MEPRGRLALLILAGVLAIPAPAEAAGVFLSQEEALELAFPGEEVERRTAFLSEARASRIEARARAKLDGRIVAYYIGKSSSAGISGYAYFETHEVRAMTETLMIVVEPDGRLRSIEVLAFYEPEDYLPTRRWLAQFRELPLEEAWIRRGVANAAGATLTSEAITAAARRILALHEVLHEDRQNAKGEEGAETKGDD